MNYKVIRFIYYIYNYRLLYYLPMEMTKKEENKSDYYVEFQTALDKVTELEETNEKLRKQITKMGIDKHKNYIDMEVYLADIKRYRETAETQRMLLDKIAKENEELKKENATLKERLDKYDTSLPF